MNSEGVDTGRLFILAMSKVRPGNLTQRAGEILAGVELVVAGDGETAGNLSDRLGIQAELINAGALEQDSAASKALSSLKAAKDVALVVQGRTPTLSDTMAELIQEALGTGIPVSPVSNGSSVEAALLASGFGASRYSFIGFLPERSLARKEILAESALRKEPLVFLEKPRTLARTIKDLLAELGSRKVCLCQGLTKTGKGIIRSDLRQLASRDIESPDQDEIIIVLAGAREGAPQKEQVPGDRTSDFRSESLENGKEAESEPERQDMQGPSTMISTRSLSLTNSRGLHARSATRIIQVLQEFKCRVWFAKDGQVVEGDSILSLLTLNCPRGSKVEVRAEGEEAEKCLDKLGLLFARNFDEE